MIPTILPVFTAVCVGFGISACGRDGGVAAARQSQGSAMATAASAAGGGTAIPTATPPADPCDWISPGDVAAIVGPLSGPPVRVRSAERPEPEASGNACLYRLSAGVSSGKPTVTVQVMLDGPVQFEMAGNAMKKIFERELNDGRPAAPAASAKTVAGWDYEGVPGPLDFVGRIGHVGVFVSAGSLDVPRAKVHALAGRVRDAVPDKPFVAVADPMLAELDAALKERGGKGLADGPTATSSGTDPCSLITRAEAEAVLGKLSVPPYRSIEDQPFADGAGPSCSYFTRGHHVLVITPHKNDGKMLFGMVKGVSGLLGSALGGASAAAQDGPWEQSASDASGALHFLKGDRMLKVTFKTASTDRSGAFQLAARAFDRF